MTAEPRFSTGHPWPQRAMLSSMMNDGSSSHVDSAELLLIELFGSRMDDDNSSHRWSSFCVPCPDDQPLWYLVLRWLKMMLLKIAQSYHAKPLILIIAPLIVGILVGYLLGARQAQLKATTQSSGSSLTLFPISFFWSVRDFGALACSRLGEWVQIRIIHTSSPFPSMESSTLTNDKSLNTSKPMDSDLPDVSADKEDDVRNSLKSDDGTLRESGVAVAQVPRHVAVIMDGNRRYGESKYGNVSKGHWDGSSKLVEFAKWCIAEHVSVLTVYAFSTENWNRDPAEVASLMAIFSKYCDELRLEALNRNIQILVLSTDTSRIPAHVKKGLERMTSETQHCTGLVMNICLSYGSRGEILNVARSLAADAASGLLSAEQIDEAEFHRRLLTSHCGDPDVLIRTSGEVRISNYLLWQLAYSEMFFLDKTWPAVEKEDLLTVIRAYANGRIRRYGK